MKLTLETLANVVDQEFNRQLAKPTIKPLANIASNAQLAVDVIEKENGKGFTVRGVITVKGLTLVVAKSTDPKMCKAAPTKEELAKLLEIKPVTQRQMRLWLLKKKNIDDDQIRASINAIPSAQDRQAALIEYDYATEYSREHKLISALGKILGLSEEEIDVAFREAAKL